MRRAVVVAFMFSFVLSLLAIGAHGQNLVDDKGLQAAREKAKATVENAFQNHKKISVILNDQRTYRGSITKVENDGFVLVNDREKRPEQVSYSDLKDVKRAGMSTGKKWAIAAAVFGGAALGVVIATKPWQSE